ncbi:MAG: YitT family protein [Oscillospiraceae bacterium]|nr:YitT family protein [Oscillospiraceae bacterium]MBQ2795951.1 YitT family protein [Oscillospiraceae bacterium]MBQ3561793.1 YitT family protein [Oscillospiraceae bacterium]
MDTTKSVAKKLYDFGMLTAASLLLVISTWLFKYPNNFTFGGITGLSIVLSRAFDVPASTLNLVMNAVLLIIGVIVLGKGFAGKTLYVTILSTVGLSFMDKIYPITKPLTDEPVIELLFAVAIPAVASAILFNMDASSGGTDIVAMLLKKYTTMEIGTAIFAVDLLITLSAFFAFDFETGLYSLTGLFAKTLIMDGAIENINLCKYFTIITTNPKPICDYIHNTLHRSATIYKAEGAYSHTEKSIVLVVLKRSQAVLLRRYIKEIEPTAFMMITNSSEIIGKGFRGFN